MTSVSEFIKREFLGWKKKEIIWMVVACAVILGISLSIGDSVLGIITAVSGIAWSILMGKGKLSSYLFGTINVVFYAIVAFSATYYGVAFMNLIVFLPLVVLGFFVWARHMNAETQEVEKRRMTIKQRLIVVAAIALGTLGLGFILTLTNDAMPFIDSFAAVTSIAAMIASVKMYAEQWWIWIVVNSFNLFMWIVNFLAGNSNMSVLLMWVVYLLNSINMLVKWKKEVQKNSA